MRKLLPTLLLLAAVAAYAQEAKTPQQLFREAGAAHQKGDFPAYLAAMEELTKLRPSHPIVIFNYAGALALNGREADSLAQLDRLVSMRAGFDLSDKDFDSIREKDAFKTLAAKMADVRTKPAGTPSVAFRIPQKDLITEALTYDAKTKTFLLSSVRKKKILAIDQKGRLRDFVPPGEWWGINGVGIDAKKRLLWASSGAYARSEGFDKSVQGKSALYAFSLDGGKLVKTVVPPAEGRHQFDDLTVGPDGAVYVSDANGAVLRLQPDAKEFDVLVPRGLIRSAQGSALSSDGKTLYVADYGAGIIRVDIASGKATPLELPRDFAGIGIDGLDLTGRTLLAVQNGVNPNRVSRLELDPTGTRVESWSVLAMNDPLMDEPTSGVLVGNDYYFVAASQGNKFDSDPPKLDQLHEAAILKVKVK